MRQRLQFPAHYRVYTERNDGRICMAAYDLVVIGSGAAGTTAATTAIHQGASHVAIVEQGPLWGTCVNTGCIPSKFLLTLAEYHYYKDHGHAGLIKEGRFNLYVALAEKDALIRHLKQKKTDRIVTELNIDVIGGSAEFLSPTETAGRQPDCHRGSDHYRNRLFSRDPAFCGDNHCPVHDERGGTEPGTGS